MIQLTSDFERFLSANYPDDYRKIIGKNVEDSLITTILSRHEQKYYTWTQIPEWIKTLFRDDLPRELFAGHEPYTNFVNFMHENFNDYTKINAITFTTSNKNNDDKSDAITLPQIDDKMLKTVTKDPDNTIYCLNILNNGYSKENSIVMTCNYNTRKELIEKGLNNTPEGKKLWRESRENDAEAINNEREVNNPEEKALSIIAREITREEAIQEYDDTIKKLKEELVTEDNEEKRANIEKEINEKKARLEKAKKIFEEEKEKNKKWKEEHPEAIAKVTKDIEDLKNKGYTTTEAKSILVNKLKRIRLHPICLTPTSSQLTQLEETKEQPTTDNRAEQRAQFLSKDNKYHEILSEKNSKTKEECSSPIKTANDEWLETRKQDIETITHNWKTKHPQKYALHLLKKHFRQQLRENKDISYETPTTAISKEQKPSIPNYLEQYNEFANSQSEPLKSALLKTANTITKKQSKTPTLSPKSRVAPNQLENMLQKNMQI